MTLLDLRRYAARSRVRIRFSADPAGECIVNEHGVLEIPSLRAVPAFNVESLLGSVERFRLEPAQNPGKPQNLSRQEMEALTGEGPNAPSEAHDD